MAITLKPLEDKIIIKQAPAETTTASGLVIPDTAKEKPQQGEVLAVGPGRRDDKGERVPMDVKEGDRVLYSKYGGTEVTYKGEDYLIVSARDVLAILQSQDTRPDTLPCAGKRSKLTGDMAVGFRVPSAYQQRGFLYAKLCGAALSDSVPRPISDFETHGVPGCSQFPGST